MATDPVQSIRVATNLAERFGALLRPGTMPTSELELRIGEAQQLYPEIWRHLDEARTALAAQGRDVAPFDHLRRDELAHLGVTDIDVSTQLDYVALIAGRLRTQQVKTATFNVAGYRRALEACRALMGAMPEIDWKALAREEDEQIRAAGSLHAAKWKGIVKWLVIAAAVVGVGVVVYRVVTSIDEEPAPRTRAQRRVDVVEAQRDEQRWARIAELRATYRATCDRAVRNALVGLLRDASQLSEAQQIESGRCTPERPSCDAVRDAIGTRLAAAFGLVQDKSWAMTCQGIMMLRGNGPEAGLAVVVSAHDTQGHVQVLRGVASLDGAHDSVTFGSAPGTRLAGIGDLDGDGGEELVFVDTTSLTISAIKGPGFRDIEGPPMPHGCAADANVEGDFRNGKKGDVKTLVLTVPDGIKAKGCLTPGRHYFRLTHDGLAETD
jgi:hypothetical protein